MSAAHEQLRIATSSDVVLVRNAVRGAATRLGLRHLDVTKVVTAASEIARNTLVYGGGGTASMGIYPRPTSILLADVAATGRLPDEYPVSDRSTAACSARAIGSASG